LTRILNGQPTIFQNQRGATFSYLPEGWHHGYRNIPDHYGYDMRTDLWIVFGGHPNFNLVEEFPRSVKVQMSTPGNANWEKFECTYVAEVVDFRPLSRLEIGAVVWSLAFNKAAAEQALRIYDIEESRAYSINLVAGSSVLDVDDMENTLTSGKRIRRDGWSIFGREEPFQAAVVGVPSKYRLVVFKANVSSNPELDGDELNNVVDGLPGWLLAGSASETKTASSDLFSEKPLLVCVCTLLFKSGVVCENYGQLSVETIQDVCSR
jgi:hypothetical protein